MKASIRCMPWSPVTRPIRKDPTSSTMEPLSRISRQRSASIFSARPPDLDARYKAEMIAGASIAAATATM